MCERSSALERHVVDGQAVLPRREARGGRRARHPQPPTATPPGAGLARSSPAAPTGLVPGRPAARPTAAGQPRRQGPCGLVWHGGTLAGTGWPGQQAPPLGSRRSARTSPSADPRHRERHGQASPRAEQRGRPRPHRLEVLRRLCVFFELQEVADLLQQDLTHLGWRGEEELAALVDVVERPSANALCSSFSNVTASSEKNRACVS